MILPGLGTIVGGLLGSLVGGVGLAASLGSVVNQVGDAYNYDIIKQNCDGNYCDVVLMARTYKGETATSTCDGCVINRKYWDKLIFSAFSAHDVHM